MKFIVIPKNDAEQVFTKEELEYARKSVDGTQVIIHEEILLEKRQQLGLSELSADKDGVIQWTYPNYEYESKELNDLLASDKWTDKEKVV